MAENPQLFGNGMPVPFYGEMFVLARDGVEFHVDKIPSVLRDRDGNVEVAGIQPCGSFIFLITARAMRYCHVFLLLLLMCSIRAPSGHAKTKGTIYLSNIRMVFVASKPVGNFFAFDMPLLFVHGEKFNQPIFHCNNISGYVEPVVPDNQNRALYSTHTFKILFKEGGCGTFVPLFLNLIASVRRHNQFEAQSAANMAPRVDPLQAAQTPVDDMMRHAYVDPNDPTKIFLQQPAPESQLRRRNYHGPADNA
ncbi:hypothetical protein HU200_000792 [Digitaria exilis]|uniref:Uncharacterized protein n=1 Tax=Digitaria exilis TaxID=1010633 RepID=A0A835G1N3_9POAL|nr:hypothetical protein HU200_000792 [Digitaria exilis]